MQMFVVKRGDVTVAEGVVFAAGATIVHSRFRRDRDSVTRFAGLGDVRQYYRGCDIELMLVTDAECLSTPRCNCERESAPVQLANE